MKNIGRLMKQAQEMQTRMAEMRERLGEVEIEGTAGAGMVVARLSGKGDLRGLKIDPALVDANEIEVLEDLIIAAVNDAKAKVEARVNDEMRKLTGGIDLPPGMSLPF